MTRMLRQWWQQPDHFYGITAILSANNAQKFTCRLVAILVLAFGVPPVVMIWSPAGPQGLTNTCIAVALAVGAAVGAQLWSRGRWPSRSQSLLYSALAGAGITASALINSNPLSGYVMSTIFAALAGYLVFFHTARYLFLLFVIAAPGVLIPLWHLVDSGDIAWACFLLVTLTIVTSAVAFVSKALVHLIGVVGPDSDIEPVTGLLNRDAFYESTGSFIASRSRLDDRHLVIIVVNLDNFTLLTDTAHAHQARISVGQALRETTRREAVVAHVSEAEFFVADSFVTPDGSALVDRIRSAIKSTPLRMTTSIGVVSTPMAKLASIPPYDVLDELIALATTAMYKARRAGGGQVNYVVCARPAALDAQSSSFGAEDAC